MDGATPVHAACYSCNVKIVSKLLGSGGDLRLHDNLGRAPKDWIMLQSEPKKKYKMIEFIEKTRYFAMGGNSKESIKGSSSILERCAEYVPHTIAYTVHVQMLMGFSQSVRYTCIKSKLIFFLD